MALTEMWRALFGGCAQMVEQGYDLVVAEARIRFREGARFDELLEVSIDHRPGRHRRRGHARRAQAPRR